MATLSLAPPTVSPRAVARVTSACVLLAVAMVAAVNLALPSLATSSLHPSRPQLLWIVDAYVVTFGCLLIGAGALGDRVGRRTALLGGLVVFAVAGVVAAAAPTVAVLIAGRVLAGVGAAAIMPATLSLAVAAHPPQQRQQAVATWTAATGIGGMAGNVGGGALLAVAPWWALFAATVPAAALLFAATLRAVPRDAPSNTTNTPLDPLGAALLTATAFTLLAAIVEGPEHGWGSTGVLAGLVAAAVLAAAWLTHGLRSRAPLLDPRLFAIRGLRAGSLGIGAAFFGLFALFFVNAQFLQLAKGYTTLQTGIAILPMTAVMFIMSRRSTRVAARLGATRVVAGGLALIVAGLLALSLATPATPYIMYLVALAALAAGMGLAAPSLSGGILRALPPERAGVGSGLNGAARELGSALGVAAIGTVLAARGVLGGGASPHAFAAAAAVGYRVVAGIVVLLALPTLAWLRDG